MISCCHSLGCAVIRLSVVSPCPNKGIPVAGRVRQMSVVCCLMSVVCCVAMSALLDPRAFQCLAGSAKYIGIRLSVLIWAFECLAGSARWRHFCPFPSVCLLLASSSSRAAGVSASGRVLVRFREQTAPGGACSCSHSQRQLALSAASFTPQLAVISHGRASPPAVFSGCAVNGQQCAKATTSNCASFSWLAVHTHCLCFSLCVMF